MSAFGESTEEIPQDGGPLPTRVPSARELASRGLDPMVAYRRVLRIGAVIALVVALLDAVVMLRLGSPVHLVFSSLAVGALGAVLYALHALRKGRLDRAVAVPLVYLLLVSPVGPFFQESRVLVSLVLPFIVMAVAVNFARVRYVPWYGAGSWVALVLVFSLWQWHMVERGVVSAGLAGMTVATAAVIVAFSFYAFSRYSVRLEGAFQGLRLANEDLSRAHRRLQGVDSARVAFINAAAHELNTPLTPIQIQMDLLERSVSKGDPAATARAVDVLERNFDRLRRLVGDLLDGARLDAGQLKMSFMELDLCALVDQALSDYRETADKAGVHLVGCVEGRLLVEADPVRLRQVMDNLLTNALKFTPEDGRIEVRVTQTADEARLVVKDSGIGMEEEALAGLFQPFRQVHDTQRIARGGSGLGLYIARGIVQRHGGRIWAESDGPGSGASFIVALPLLRAVSYEAGVMRRGGSVVSSPASLQAPDPVAPPARASAPSPVPSARDSGLSSSRSD